MKRVKHYIKIIFSKPDNKAETKIKIINISFVFPYIKRLKIKFIVAFCLLVINSILILPSPAITGYIIDKVFINKDLTKLSLLVILLVMILLISNFGKIVQEYYFSRLSREFTYLIRSDLFERILKLPMSFFNGLQTGYLVSRIDEVNYLGSFFREAFYT